MSIARLSVIVSAAALTAAAGAHAAVFSNYVIRHDGGNNPPQILPNNVYVPGATEFVISAGGMKAAAGTNDLNGSTLGSISNLSITRHDDAGRFIGGSGQAVAPYFNIWITDGVNYAVIANEPSNGSFAAFRSPIGGGGFTYSFSLNDIANEPAKVFETPGAAGGTSWVHVATGQSVASLKFSHLLSMVVGAPSAAYVTNPTNMVGTGAPDEIGTNFAYGINWVFGDTLSNYVSGPSAEGFVVSGINAIPAPGAAAILGLGGLVAARRRRN